VNYYAARQRTDGCWDWTCYNRRIGTWADGACIDHKCKHATKEEAEEHEAQRRREKAKAGAPKEIDTKHGHNCEVPECKEKAFHWIMIHHHPMELCKAHLADLSWYRVSGEEMSSY
jgi:hypothetical protein